MGRLPGGRIFPLEPASMTVLRWRGKARRQNPEMKHDFAKIGENAMSVSTFSGIFLQTAKKIKSFSEFLLKSY